MTWNNCAQKQPPIGTLIMVRWFDAIEDIYRYQGGTVCISHMGPTIFDHQGISLYLNELMEWKEVDRGVE
jgi:hypothetical protein